jgi:hypothetical protein
MINFEIVSGKARVRVRWRVRRATAGESVVVPRGTGLRFWKDGQDEKEFRDEASAPPDSNVSSSTDS